MTSWKTDRKRAIVAIAILGLGIAAISNVSAATPLKQNPAPVIGGVAPAIKLEKLLQAPPNASTDWDKLKGKVVVLDFWAMWCSPCIAAIPHLNQLAEEFSSQPVVFIAITDDSEARLKSFLKTSPVKTWIGIDSERTNWPSFDIHGIPATVIVGADGRLVTTTTSSNLTAQVLHDVIDRKTVKLPPMAKRNVNMNWDQEEIEWKDGVSPYSEVIIKPISNAGQGGTRYLAGGNNLTADSAQLDSLVVAAYQTDAFHLDWRIPRSDQAYRAVARVPKGYEQQLLPLFQNALAATFGLKMHWEQEEKDVYVLRIPESGKPRLTSATSDEKAQFSAMRGQASAKRQPLTTLCSFLTIYVLSLPVVDETGLAGNYDWELPIQPGQPNVTTEAVKDRLGLELIKARRSINMLVVERDETIQRH